MTSVSQQAAQEHKKGDIPSGALSPHLAAEKCEAELRGLRTNKVAPIPSGIKTEHGSIAEGCVRYKLDLREA